MKEGNEKEAESKEPRKMMLKTEGIPMSTPNTLIIPPNSHLNSFSRKAYVSNFCKDFISKTEFDEIIDSLCKIASIAYTKKRENDNKQLSPKVISVFWV